MTTKKIYFPISLAIALLSLTACQGVPAFTYDDPSPATSGIDVTARISQEAVSRAGLTDYVKRINAVLVDGNSEVVAQAVTDASSATVSLDAPAGDYTLFLTANKGDAPVVQTDGTLKFGKVGDCYSYAHSVTIGKVKRASLSAEMDRCVAMLSFVSLDDVPSSVAKFKVKVSGISTIYDPDAHYGTDVTSYEATGNASPNIINGKFDSFTYCLLPDQSITDAKLTLTFLDAQGTEINSVTFPDLPLTQNRKTVLKAAMFHEHGGDASVTVNATWGQDINVER